MKASYAIILAWALVCLMPVYAFFSLLLLVSDGSDYGGANMLLLTVGYLSFLLTISMPGVACGLFYALYKYNKRDVNIIGMVLTMPLFVLMIATLVGPVAFYFTQRIKIEN